MKLKKILSSLAIVGALAAVMGASVLAAEGDPTLKIVGPTEAVQPGQPVTLTVYGQNLPKLLSLSFKVEYDEIFKTTEYANLLNITTCSGTRSTCGVTTSSHNTKLCSGTLTNYTNVMHPGQIGASGMFTCQVYLDGLGYDFTPGREGGIANGTDGQAIGTITLDFPTNATPGKYDFTLSIDTANTKERTDAGDVNYTGTINVESCAVTIAELEGAVLEDAQLGNKVDDLNAVKDEGEWYTFYTETTVNFDNYPGALMEVCRWDEEWNGPEETRYFSFPSGLSGLTSFQVIFKTKIAVPYEYRVVASDKSAIAGCEEYKLTIVE